MMKHDWSKFIHRVNIKSSIADIYNAWTTQTGLEKWFLRKAEFRKFDRSKRASDSNILTSDTYEWLWHGWNNNTLQRGTILHLTAMIHCNLHLAKLVL